MRTLVLVLASAFAFSCTHPYRCTPIYAGDSGAETVNQGGWLVNEKSGVTVARFCAGGDVTLRLESAGNLTDTLKLPRLRTRQVFLMGRDCRIDGQEDPEIFAIGAGPGPNFPQVVRAWRADSSTGMFSEISVGGVSCWAEELVD